jgi:hypothetical protein
MAHPPYNPLDKTNLGKSVADALLARPVGPLPPPATFAGAGIYVIYYVGDLELYRPIAEQNKDNKFAAPIYIGKAVPAGARKGGFGLGLAPGNVLYARLFEHARSIEVAEDLRTGDFRARYLIADDIWIPLGESLLIQQFQPIWNVLIDGFGNHDPGGGRRQQQRSAWDALHPGRSWAHLLQAGTRSRVELRQLVRDFFEGRAVPTIPPEQAVTEEE